MSTVYFITHTEVVVDASIPVPRWHLSDQGIRRMRAFAASLELQDLTSIWASTETKAIEAAGLLAGHFGLPVAVHPDLHENDRRATGFLPPAEFERVANAFFAQPLDSVRGWERARDAQARVSSAVDEIVAGAPEGSIAVVAHGGVGTLLLCQYLGGPISREFDQPFQGHYWAFNRATRQILHPWRPVAPR